VVAGFSTVRGVGEGFGGAIVRVRVGVADESTVELLLFWANAATAQKQTTETATKNFFIWIPSEN